MLLYFSKVIQFCIMVINTQALDIFMITLTFAFDCPSSTWVQHKLVEDDATRIYNIGLEQFELSFTLKRTIHYNERFTIMIIINALPITIFNFILVGQQLYM